MVRRAERERIGLEESRQAAEQRRPVALRVVKSRPRDRQAPLRLALHAAPEFLQPLHAVFDVIAGDEAGIDGADRGADDPVGLDSRLVQRLIDADLIGAERAAALQDEPDLLTPLWHRSNFVSERGLRRDA